MEFIIYSAGLLIVIFLLFTAIERPYIVASILIFFYIYNLNMELPGPLDSRGLITAVLFARLIVFDRQNFLLIKNYLFRDLNWILILFFLAASLYTTYYYQGGLQQQLKVHLLLLVSLLLGFIIIINGEGKKVFFYAIVISGVFTTIDILYSTLTFSSLRARSLIRIIFFGDNTTFNHNPLGLVCGFALILVIFERFIKKKISRKFSTSLIFILSLGVIISTSRSTLIALIVTLVILFLVQKEIKFNPNKILITTSGVILFFISFYFIYNTILSSGQLKSSFVDQTYYRLYEEPMSIFGGNEQKVFNKFGHAKEGNTRWRINRAMTDISTYLRLDPETQLFGLGLQGYIKNEFGGDDANAHNGYVLLLVERGLFGFIIFLFLTVNLSFRTFKLLRRNSVNIPIVYLFLVLLFYSIGQNGELTHNLAFLFFGAMIANTKEHLVFENELDDNLDTSLLPQRN